MIEELIMEWLPSLEWMADNIFFLSTGLIVVWILSTIILVAIYCVVGLARKLGLIKESY